HLPTVWWVSPNRWATTVLARPPAHSSTMRERWAKACAVFGRRAQRSRLSRSSAVTVNGAIGLPVLISVPPRIRETLKPYTLFNGFMTQDTRASPALRCGPCRRGMRAGSGAGGALLMRPAMARSGAVMVAAGVMTGRVMGVMDG